MSQKAYSGICAAIFLAAAVMHLSRLIAGWEILIGPWVIPHWISIPGLLVAGLLSAWGFRLALRSAP